MKNLSTLLILLLGLSVAVPAFAAPTIGGDLTLGATQEQGQPIEFDATLGINISGNVSDEVSYAARLKATGNASDIKGAHAGLDYLYLTFSPGEIPVKVEGGLLSFGTTPLMIYANTFSGSRTGVRVIPTLPNGLSAWALVVPDANTKVDGNQVLYAGSLGKSGSFGSANGILWKQSDEDAIGWAANASLNVVKDKLVVYGEYGKDVAGKEYEVVGAYLPIVSKKAGFDPYIEYDVQNGLLGVYVEKAFANNLTFGFTASQDSTSSGEKVVTLSPSIWITF